MVSKFQTNTVYAQRGSCQIYVSVSMKFIRTTHIACIKDMRFTMYPNAKRTVGCGGIAQLLYLIKNVRILRNIV